MPKGMKKLFTKGKYREALENLLKEGGVKVKKGASEDELHMALLEIPPEKLQARLDALEKRHQEKPLGERKSIEKALIQLTQDFNENLTAMGDQYRTAANMDQGALATSILQKIQREYLTQITHYRRESKEKREGKKPDFSTLYDEGIEQRKVKHQALFDQTVLAAYGAQAGEQSSIASTYREKIANIHRIEDELSNREAQFAQEAAKSDKEVQASQQLVKGKVAELKAHYTQELPKLIQVEDSANLSLFSANEELHRLKEQRKNASWYQFSDKRRLDKQIKLQVKEIARLEGEFADVNSRVTHLEKSLAELDSPDVTEKVDAGIQRDANAGLDESLLRHQRAMVSLENQLKEEKAAAGILRDAAQRNLGPLYNAQKFPDVDKAPRTAADPQLFYRAEARAFLYQIGDAIAADLKQQNMGPNIVDPQIVIRAIADKMANQDFHDLEKSDKLAMDFLNEVQRHYYEVVQTQQNPLPQTHFHVEGPSDEPVAVVYRHRDADGKPLFDLSDAKLHQVIKNVQSKHPLMAAVKHAMAERANGHQDAIVAAAESVQSLGQRLPETELVDGQGELTPDAANQTVKAVSRQYGDIPRTPPRQAAAAAAMDVVGRRASLSRITSVLDSQSPPDRAVLAETTKYEESVRLTNQVLERIGAVETEEDRKVVKRAQDSLMTEELAEFSTDPGQMLYDCIQALNASRIAIYRDGVKSDLVSKKDAKEELSAFRKRINDGLNTIRLGSDPKLAEMAKTVFETRVSEQAQVQEQTNALLTSTDPNIHAQLASAASSVTTPPPHMQTPPPVTFENAASKLPPPLHSSTAASLPAQGSSAAKLPPPSSPPPKPFGRLPRMEGVQPQAQQASVPPPPPPPEQSRKKEKPQPPKGSGQNAAPPPPPDKKAPVLQGGTTAVVPNSTGSTQHQADSATTVVPNRPNGMNALLGAIRAGKTLNSVDQEALAKQRKDAPPTAPTGLFGILAGALSDRRAHMEAEAEVDDDDELDWDSPRKNERSDSTKSEEAKAQKAAELLQKQRQEDAAAAVARQEAAKKAAPQPPASNQAPPPPPQSVVSYRHAPKPPQQSKDAAPPVRAGVLEQIRQAGGGFGLAQKAKKHAQLSTEAEALLKDIAQQLNPKDMAQVLMGGTKGFSRSDDADDQAIFLKLIQLEPEELEKIQKSLTDMEAGMDRNKANQVGQYKGFCKLAISYRDDPQRFQDAMVNKMEKWCNVVSEDHHTGEPSFGLEKRIDELHGLMKDAAKALKVELPKDIDDALARRKEVEQAYEAKKAADYDDWDDDEQYTP